MTDLPSREPSALDRLADLHLDRMVALSPMMATNIGVPGFDHELDDFSPDGVAAKADVARQTLAALDLLDKEAGEAFDAVDKVTASALRDRLGSEVDLFEAGEAFRFLNVVCSPQHELEDIFTLMPQATAGDWEAVADRLHAIPAALAGYQATLAEGGARRSAPARYQVELAVRDAGKQAGDGSVFAGLARRAEAADWKAERPDVADAVVKGAASAQAAFAGFAQFLEDRLKPLTEDADAAGEERYRLLSRHFLGAAIDPRETYEWGREELARIVAEEEAIAESVLGPGATPEAAIASFHADPALRLHGTAALRDWMQATADAAVRALDGVHFDIPGPVKTIEACIAPTQTGGIYYTAPNDDFTRPGRMWWSVPAGVEDFAVWKERTTVYHEGVPGHHLQCGQAVYLGGTLNRWRRLGCWVSGHGEGWALYAERLADELGFHETPADRRGMLDGQRLRAARVVLDIGVHLGLPYPEGGTWNRDNAWEFLRANSAMDAAFLRYELDRYLGWPGQAPSYKIGQRLWEQHRDAALARGLSLKEFHSRALDLGSVGLDTLAEALAA
jgi:uncharacterized protein (DUF885 family)